MIQHLKWLPTLFSVSYFSKNLRLGTYILPYVSLIGKKPCNFQELQPKIIQKDSNIALVGHQDRPQDTLGELVAQVHQKKKY
jgi:hypothetical protein